MKKIKDVLPIEAYKILTLATEDLIAAKTEGICIDMRSWAIRADTDKTTFCSVCHAGSLLTGTLKDQTERIKNEKRYFDEEGCLMTDQTIPSSLTYKFYLINNIREDDDLIQIVHDYYTALKYCRVITPDDFKKANNKIKGLHKALSGLADFELDDRPYRDNPEEKDFYGDDPQSESEFKSYIDRMIVTIGILKSHNL